MSGFEPVRVDTGRAGTQRGVGFDQPMRLATQCHELRRDGERLERALGNLVDRIRLGEVVDFLHLSVGRFSWPIFNVADIGVSVGVALLALHLFRKDETEAKSPDETGNHGNDAAGADPARERG